MLFCNRGRPGRRSLGVMLHGLPMQRFESIKHLTYHNRLWFVKSRIDPKLRFCDSSGLTLQPVDFQFQSKAGLHWIFSYRIPKSDPAKLNQRSTYLCRDLKVSNIWHIIIGCGSSNPELIRKHWFYYSSGLTLQLVGFQLQSKAGLHWIFSNRILKGDPVKVEPTSTYLR